MLIYILKSGACLAIFLLFYKLFLEKENMHVFKRFYLLAALLLSMIIPAIVFTEYVEISETTYTAVQQLTTTNEVVVAPPVIEAAVFDIEPLLWTVYFLGMLFFGIKFLRNLFQILNRIRSNPKQRLTRFTQVLLQETFPPHTFFSYIFLNRKKLESNEIPKEVLLHEETHAEQKHSWDVVFVELLHVIFWVNPFVYLTKKAIKLNHEFLADQAVLKKAVDQNTYQNTLLSYLSPDSQKKYQPSLPNAINYSSIKKRFTVMKKQTSKKAILLRSLLLLPLLALMLYGFSETIIVQKKEAIANSNNRPLLKSDSFKPDLNADRISNRSVELAGLILDSETLLPLENVEIHDSNGNLLSKTDDKGYYKVLFDKLNQGEIRFEYTLHKKGYKINEHKEHWGNLQGKIKSTYYFGLQKKEANTPEFSEYILNNKNLSYESILSYFYLVQNRFEFNKKLNIAKKGNQHVLIKVDDTYYLVSDTGWININSKADLISIDDNQIVPASKLNNLMERKAITGMTPLDNVTALFGIYTAPGGITNNKTQYGVTIEQNLKGNDILIFINKNGQLLLQENKLIELKGLKSYLLKINKHLSKEEREKVVRVKIVWDKNKSAPKNVVASVEKILKDYGVATIDIVGPENFSLPTQDGASKKQIFEFNKLAKHYNEMDSFGMSIKKKDVERLNYIYNRMSDKQRAEAAPFPDFPNPPPPPSGPNVSNEEGVNVDVINPKTADYKALYNEHSGVYIGGKKITYAALMGMEKEGQINSVELIKKPSGENIIVLNDIKFPPVPPVSPVAPHDIRAVKTNGEYYLPPPPPTATNMESKSPPPPPEPMAPLDHVIEMAKKGATFYYEGKEVSSDKAIDLMKKNKSLNIETKQHNSKKPQVKITKAPITIDRSSNTTPSSNNNVETGNIEINGKEHFYSTKGGVTNYFNSRGEQVDKKGKLLGQHSKKNPTFYYNGQQITSAKAHLLLSNNTSIQVTNEEYSDSEYAIILTDLNSSNVKNPNLMNNPNSTIDLTEVISKGAVFFYNDKAITTEKALWLTQNDNMDRVQVKEGKNKKPEVYFWNTN